MNAIDTKKMKKSILTILLLALSLALAAQNKVALLETLNGDKTVKVEGIEKNMVRGELRKAISNQQGFQAFTRTDVDQLMKEHDFQNSGMVSDSQRKRLGEMSGADYICVSTLTKSNTQFYLEAYLIDVETGEIFNPATQYGMLKDGTYANLFQLCQNLAQELIGNVDVSVSGSNSYTTPFRGGNNSSGKQGASVITIQVGNVSFEMVKVEAGSFTMGCTSEQSDCYDDESPYHRVVISNDYYIGKFEVTQELWEAVMGTNPSYFKGFDKPVESVSWNEAQEFCAELSRMTGRRFRLPTEAEWEYAARGGNKSTSAKFSGSSSVDNVAWYDGNSSSQTHPVGKLRPNELGIYDMSGNVWEWCQDWYGSYASNTQTDPHGPSSGSIRVLRGGCWDYNARFCRVSYRNYCVPGDRLDSYGFRLLLPQ